MHNYSDFFEEYLKSGQTVTTLSILSCWLLGFFQALPLMSTWNNPDVSDFTSCSLPFLSPAWIWGVAITVFIIPTIVIVVSYGMIAKQLFRDSTGDSEAFQVIFLLLSSSCDQLVPGDLRDDLLDGGLLVLLVAGLHLPQREVEGRHWFQRFQLQTDQDQHYHLCHHFGHHIYHQVSTSASSTAWSTRSSTSSSTPPSRPRSSTFSGAANSKRSVLVSRRANQMCFPYDAAFLFKI